MATDSPADNASGVQYRIIGMPGSPYSIKMRALFRYRRIPYLWIQHNDRTRREVRDVRPPLIPVVQFPDGGYRTDSTPIIYELEGAHGARSVLPDDEAMAFVAHLLEDMADEWVTKIMFHYRWFYPRDRQQVSEWLAYDELGPEMERLSRFADEFRERQVGRMALVGCTEHNRPLIEDSFKEAIALIDDHLRQHAFLLAARPSLADFAWMGQLFQLAMDPASGAIMRRDAPFLYRWLMQMDDLSGLEPPHWGEFALNPGTRGLLRMAGDIYLPFLEANAQALAAGRDEFYIEARGMPYRQKTFRYQYKCLLELQRRFRDLGRTAREKLIPVLKETGCYIALCRDL